jgi:hypothetical protein
VVWRSFTGFYAIHGGILARMKTDTFTKTTFATVALALVVLAGENINRNLNEVHAATTEAWQYKFIHRQFTPDFESGQVRGDSWVEDGQTSPNGKNSSDTLGARIQELGSQGWELVTDTAFSTHANQNPQKPYAWNGVVSDELLIFKRRK